MCLYLYFTVVDLDLQNDIFFEHRRVIDPFVILLKTYHLINSWSILCKKKEELRELNWGLRLLEQVASEVFHASKGWHPEVVTDVYTDGDRFSYMELLILEASFHFASFSSGLYKYVRGFLIFSSVFFWLKNAVMELSLVLVVAPFGSWSLELSLLL